MRITLTRVSLSLYAFAAFTASGSRCPKIFGGGGDAGPCGLGALVTCSRQESLLSEAGLLISRVFSLGVDFVQEKFMGQGKQDNESAAEQAKDEAISDMIRQQYKSTTGSDIPLKDKERF